MKRALSTYFFFVVANSFATSACGLDTSATAYGPFATETDPTVLGFNVATVRGSSVPAPEQTTHTVVPSGVIARAEGSLPTTIGGEATPVLVAIAVTLLVFATDEV